MPEWDTELGDLKELRLELERNEDWGERLRPLGFDRAYALLDRVEELEVTNAWVVTGECGDYYCGCGVGHLIAVTLDSSKVDALVEKALAATHIYIHTSPTYRGDRGPSRSYRSWSTVESRCVPLDELLSYSGPWSQNTDRTQDGAEIIKT